MKLSLALSSICLFSNGLLFPTVLTSQTENKNSIGKDDNKEQNSLPHEFPIHLSESRTLQSSSHGNHDEYSFSKIPVLKWTDYAVSWNDFCESFPTFSINIDGEMSSSFQKHGRLSGNGDVVGKWDWKQPPDKKALSLKTWDIHNSPAPTISKFSMNKENITLEHNSILSHSLWKNYWLKKSDNYLSQSGTATEAIAFDSWVENDLVYVAVGGGSATWNSQSYWSSLSSFSIKVSTFKLSGKDSSTFSKIKDGFSKINNYLKKNWKWILAVAVIFISLVGMFVYWILHRKKKRRK